ncbi:hypothetical protein BC830DRAFT_1078536 [Chytriomyces sp. MP71]|nr:hypothetical protein BC830DRAFT_1078536 [Chytriomyces sp. MP71]
MSVAEGLFHTKMTGRHLNWLRSQATYNVIPRFHGVQLMEVTVPSEFAAVTTCEHAHYLSHVGISGIVTESLSLAPLRAVALAHSKRIPFSNATAHREPPYSSPDRATSHKRLVSQRRGGSCLENNIHVRSALLALGFDASAGLAHLSCGLKEEHGVPIPSCT